MKKKYTKKQIQEAIAYWQRQIKRGNYKKLNESVEDLDSRIKNGTIVCKSEKEANEIVDYYGPNYYEIDADNVSDEVMDDNVTYPSEALDYFASKLNYHSRRYKKDGEYDISYKYDVDDPKFFGKNVNKFGFYIEYTDKNDETYDVFCDCRCMI